MFYVRYLRASICKEIFYRKKVKTRNFWIFGLWTQERIIVSIWNIVGFQQRGRQDSQKIQ